jgi:hypothetical protein
MMNLIQQHIAVRLILCFSASLYISNVKAQTESKKSQDDYSGAHVFNNFGDIQSIQQQALLLGPNAPLPYSVFGSVRDWTTGPSKDKLITQTMQGLYKINDQWKVIGQELYQKQGGMNLTNTILGVNYRPDEDLGFNFSAGAGTGYLYTNKYSFSFSPHYSLPTLGEGKKNLSVEANLYYQEFSLGNFKQFVPKINWQASEYMPPLSFAYAFGSFRNSTSAIINQYYQAKIIHGAVVNLSLPATQNSFLILSYYPYNKNIIGGSTVTQDTLGATWNYKISEKLHFTLYSEYQNTRNSSVNLVFGGSINFGF